MNKTFIIITEGGNIVVQGNFTKEQVVKNYTKQFVNYFDGEIPTN